MNKSELIDFVREKAGLSKTDAQNAVNAIFDPDSGAIATTLQRGDNVSLPGFGTFKVSSRAARVARNPRTGEPINVPASRSAGFSAGKTLKDALN